MTIPRTRTLILSAPGGATVLGSEIAGPPGCDSGTVGGVKRSRSRPGSTLGGTGCAMAVAATTTIANAAIKRRTPARIPLNPQVTDLPSFFRGAPAVAQCHYGFVRATKRHSCRVVSIRQQLRP